MENGGLNGALTNHDRYSKLNGVNGAGTEGQQNAADKGKVAFGGDSGGIAVNGNGPETNGPRQQQPPSAHELIETPRMNDLPDEIVHITQGFIPISLLLTRLAQTTHNSLQDKIADLAKMPVPANALNGNSLLPANVPDDSSNENLRKKSAILNFTQDMHAKWIKALVITEWSRKSEMVSKLIDLKFHIDQQRILFDAALDNIVNVKRDLTFARMPSPDLKTALQVLSTGKAHWMPDLQYIEPPPLTSDEQIKWMNDLNTLLSLRLNLEDFDKIPYHFRNYEIDSGRVTFRVPGEFEVDLTIADEDFEKQFWFIDFRFIFTPSAAALPESLKNYLEAYVNDVLSKDGLAGCYQFLHEFVLTHKLNELKRQAIQLSKNAWTGTLIVEPLNRALAIQYWTSRTPPNTHKSWVLIAVNSGRKQTGHPNPKESSYLTAKWYRDNKEVKDVVIPLDVENLSAETLLRTVVGRHIDYNLSSIHNKLQEAPRFLNREAGMVLHISQSDPGASSLTMHVGYSDSASLLMEPTTGLFAVKPHSKFTIQYEHQLNNGKNPEEDGVSCLENVRCGFMEDELNRRGSTMGWNSKKCPLNSEELRSVVKTKKWTRTIWLQRDGWGPNWNRDIPNHASRFQARLPLNKGHPDLCDAFWNNLTLFATGMIAQSVDMRELHRNHIKSRPNGSRNWALPQQVRLPSIEIALSGIFPTMVLDTVEKDISKESNEQADTVGEDTELASIVRPPTGLGVIPSTQQPWANDIVAIRFKEVQPPRRTPTPHEGATSDSPLMCVSDAIIRVRKPGKFAALKGMVDRDVSYNPQKGEFCLRIRHGIGQSLLSTLKSRVKAVDRFVNFLESMDKAKGTIQSESVTLRQVVFSYTEPAQDSDGDVMEPTQRWKVLLDLSKDNIDVRLERGNPHLRVVDLMQSLVNSEGGIEALMVWLPVSLPALGGIERIETAWTGIQARLQGQVEFSMKTIDWMSIRYTLAAPSGVFQQPKRQVTLEVRMKVRRGEPWWHIWRSDSGIGPPPEDEYTAALKPIWEGRGEDWHGLTSSAAARPNKGVVNLLTAIDGAIRPLAGVSVGRDGGSKVVVID
ncbi:Mediator of RNA polymerase II transcription subunit 14 [Neonectria ditissima]|uniref:Mediator of RNA polymerase II transcription subunit 14 n=1 Tax=Neonectria ditissima TaxID=78410 RepID=A0A0N8H855_9HYPO|nr:Mediator of RNA polymerase II transcription subunit 14 [Neonectria ditissima]